MTQVDSHSWRRIATLFDELVELPAPERAQRLAALADTDPLVAEEVGVLLRADSEAEGVLEASMSEVSPELARAAGPGAWETLAGSEFGPYRLVEPVGEGGMGEVWRAERIDGAYRQQVALKLLKRGMDTQAILRRFVQERNILARLEHPNIVHLLDGGMSPDGRPWYAMAFVEGQPVGAHAAAARLGVRERVALIATVAEAVAYAHSRLVIHRDLKPGNILVDRQGEPRLLDFGIAKLLEDTGDQTVTGTRLMSPAYAAPEQILGQPVGTATDVYALAAILYELLAGRLPHRRGSRDPRELVDGLARPGLTERASVAIARGDAQVLARSYGPGAEPRRLARQVGADLDLILAMALRPEPERRYVTAAAFAADLRAWLAGRPVAARPDSGGYRVRRFLRRNLLGVAAAALVCLSLLTGLGLALWQADIARAQAMRAEQQARRAEATKNFVVSAFTGLSPTVARDGNQLRLSDFLALLLQRLDDALVDAPEARIELRTQLATALQELGELDAASTAFTQAEREALALPSLSAQALGVLLHSVAMNHQRRGDYDAAEDYLRRSIAALAEDVAGVSQTRVSVRTTRAYLAIDRGRYREGLAEYLAIRDDRLALNGVEDARMAVDWMNLCVARWWLADYRLAELDCLKARSLLESDPQSPRARLAWVGNALGLVQASQGRWTEAVETYRASLATVEQTLGAEHPMARLLANNLASAELDLGDPRGALARVEGVLGQLEPGDAADPVRRSGYGIKLSALTALDRLAEADAVAAALGEPRLSGSNPMAELRLARRLAELDLAGRRLQPAQRRVEQVLDRYRQLGMQHHDDYARALLVAADLVEAGGDRDAAAAKRQQARAIARAVLGDGHPMLRVPNPG